MGQAYVNLILLKTGHLPVTKHDHAVEKSPRMEQKEPGLGCCARSC